MLADLTHGYTHIHHWTKIRLSCAVRGVVSDKPLLTGPVAVHTSSEVCGSVCAWDTCPLNVEGFVELHNAVLVLFFFPLLKLSGGLAGKNFATTCFITSATKKIRRKAFFLFCFCQGVQVSVLSLLLFWLQLYIWFLCIHSYLELLHIHMQICVYTNTYLHTHTRTHI